MRSFYLLCSALLAAAITTACKAGSGGLFDLSPAPAAVKPRRLSSPKRVMPRYVLPDGTVVERKLPPLHPPVMMER